MKQSDSNPLLEAVKAAVGFPTIEDLLCEGKMVDYEELKEFLGDRLKIPKQKICKSHAKGLAAHIYETRTVYVPITITQIEGGYEVTNGFHRIAALEMIKEQDPDVIISVKATLKD